MKITITNVRGISSADIDTAKITLIAGLNGSGKTSALQAIGAALTGIAMPIEGLAKNQAGVMVHAGTAAGEVVIDNAVGTAKLTYPDAKRSTTGEPVEISDHAAGLDSVLDGDAKTRSKILGAILKTEPTKESVGAELAKIGGTPELTEAVWKTIQAQGWDAAHAQAKEKGIKFKGQWEGLTSERYGTKKSQGWMPPAWEVDLDGVAEETLATAVRQEQEWLEAAISDQAVDDAELARLRTTAEGRTDCAAVVDLVQGEMAALQKNLTDISAGIAKLPPAEQPKSIPCPHCGGALSVCGSAVAIQRVLTDEEIAARAGAISEARAALTAVGEQIREVQPRLDSARASLAECVAAADKLAKTKSAPSKAASGSGVNDCRARLLRAQNRLAAKQARTQANRLATMCEQNAAIVDILAADGLRMTALNAALAGFNARMLDLCVMAAWRPVSVKSDMSICYGGSPYAMLSESEQYRVRVILQIAMAALDGSGLILLDRADILDAPGRNGLFWLLTKIEPASIVGMTVNKIEQVPILEKLGGRSYWLTNGVMEEVKK